MFNIITLHVNIILIVSFVSFTLFIFSFFLFCFLLSLAFFSLFPFSVCVSFSLFRQNTYLQNKKHTLTCQVGLVVTDLITSPVVSWEGWETTPPPPSTEALLSFFAQPPAW